MAHQIPLLEWLAALHESGHNISLDFHVLEINGNSVRVLPVIRAGDLSIWQGEERTLASSSALSVAGFELEGRDLVLKNFGDYI